MSITRREFLQQSSLIAGGAALASLILASACTSQKSQTATNWPTSSEVPATQTVSASGLRIYRDETLSFAYIIAPGCTSKIAMDRLYSLEDLWVKVEAGNIARIGITERFALYLGGISAVDLPGAGLDIPGDGTFGSIEGIKMNTDLISPLHGKVIERNSIVMSARTRGRIMADPYQEGWLISIKLSQPAEIDALLTPDEYAAAIAQ